MKKIIIILFAIIAIGGSLKAQVTVSLFPYKYAEGTLSQIRYYRIFQTNKYENGQNNEPTTTDYYHYKYIIPLQLSTLTNVKKIVSEISIDSGLNDGSYPINKTVNILNEDGIVIYELDGVKREIKNNRILIDGELTTNKITDTSSQYSFRYVISVYDSSGNLLRSQYFGIGSNGGSRHNF